MVAKKSAVIGLALIAIMLFSTFAFAMIQAFNFGTGQQKPKEEVTLPESNIFSYALTREQENKILQQGKTIAKFYYPIGCLECESAKSVVESIGNSYRDQIYVQELTTSGDISLTISSSKATEKVSNFTSDSIFSSFCNVMFNPPVDCALRNV